MGFKFAIPIVSPSCNRVKYLYDTNHCMLLDDDYYVIMTTKTTYSGERYLDGSIGCIGNTTFIHNVSFDWELISPISINKYVFISNNVILLLDKLSHRIVLWIEGYELDTGLDDMLPCIIKDKDIYFPSFFFPSDGDIAIRGTKKMSYNEVIRFMM